MNIFRLDNDPFLAAKAHCDKHVVKMILETAQLLSTTHRVVDGTPVRRGNKIVGYQLSSSNADSVLYKPTHINHPCAQWARAGSGNYLWLQNLGDWLCEEYTSRYGRIHKCQQLIRGLLQKPPRNILSAVETEQPQCVADDCKDTDVVTAYRRYYKIHKSDIAVWNYSTQPSWW